MRSPLDPKPIRVASEHWSPLANYWKQVGTPLRPSFEDSNLYLRFAQEWIDCHGTPRVLLLGVTPEIYQLPWPKGHTFIAADRTPAMIEHVWPGSRANVVLADWRSLPFRPDSFDLVFCDGGLHLLSYPDGQRQLINRLHQVVAPGGRCIFRLFVPPSTFESPEMVLKDLLAGQIENLNLLKLRLGMAMQSSPQAGSSLRSIWNRLRELSSDWQTLATLLQWEFNHLKAIDAYRDSEALYHFVSITEAANLFCEFGQFSYNQGFIPDYPLGERCPFVVFERPDYLT